MARQVKVGEADAIATANATHDGWHAAYIKLATELGSVEYMRNKYRNALQRIIDTHERLHDYAENNPDDYQHNEHAAWGAKRCADIAVEALKVVS